jgi:hypothetical protein
MPVITTKYNGACDLFSNNRHGKIIDSPENIDALVTAMQYYTDTLNTKKAVAAIANDNLRDKISINRHCSQLMQLYESILQNRNKKWQQ